MRHYTFDLSQALYNKRQYSSTLLMPFFFGLLVFSTLLLASRVDVMGYESGPDQFGYVSRDEREPDGPTFGFIDISQTGTPVGITSSILGGVGSAPLPLGFTFNFYGTNFTEVAMSSNGYLNFNLTHLTNHSASHCPVPNNYTPNSSIYVLWDRLVIDGDGFYQTFAACPNTSGGAGVCTVFMWHNARHAFTSPDHFSFEVILYGNGNILMQYTAGNPDQGELSTTGIENADASDGLTHTCHFPNSIVAGRAILFTHPAVPPPPPPKDGTIPCFSTHTSGSGATYMQICLSDRGNLAQFTSGFQQLHSEGYAVCSGDAFHVRGFDAGLSQSGFGPPTISQPNGPDTFPLTITRDTTDGILQLVQKFSRDTAEQDVTITMTLKNLSSSPVQNVFLTRYFDGDIGGRPMNRYNATFNSVVVHDVGITPYVGGLMLTALTFSTYHYTEIEKFVDWSRDTCSARIPQSAPRAAFESIQTPAGDFVGRVTYGLGTLNPGKSKTVKVLYRHF